MCQDCNRFRKGEKIQRAVFLDRDGVILEERGYLSHPGDVSLIAGAAEAIKLFSRLGLKVVVVTNQSGIGRGLFTRRDYLRVKAAMDALLARQGAKTDGEYFCPHAPWEECGCRKPAPGLALIAGKELGLNLDESFVVGDKRSDMEMARAIRAKSILVRTGYGWQTEKDGKPIWDAVAQDIGEAAKIIARWIEGSGDVGHG